MKDQQLIVQRYEIGAVIGQGGMGTVYRAVDRRTQQPVGGSRTRQGAGTGSSRAATSQRTAATTA